MLLMLPEDADMARRLMEMRRQIDELELSFSELAAEFKESKRWENMGGQQRHRVDPVQLQHDLQRRRRPHRRR
jgi:hypothetical protein